MFKYGIGNQFKTTQSDARQAFCELRSDGGSGVSGLIKLEQAAKDSSIRLKGRVNGLPAGEHGFHVHADGDISAGCKGAGGHFNPFSKEHGGPEDDERHVGDLGNING